MAWLALTAILPARGQERRMLDQAQSRAGFEIQTHFGQRLEGLFPFFDGEIVALSDGREQVHLRIDATRVEITGKPLYTAWIRGEHFFDVSRYPTIEFNSLPYPKRVVLDGGEIGGTLTIRGISHFQILRVAPAECTRPGYDCDVVSRGTVMRGRYGMDAWQWVLSDKVTFILQGRLPKDKQL